MATKASISLELSLSRNLFGPLKSAQRKRLQALVNHPSQKTWNNAYSMAVGSDGWMTLWQAVLAVRPSFCPSKPCDEPWPEIPSRETIVAALQYATH